MGGYGSGRTGRPTNEQTASFVINAVTLTRAKLRPGMHGTATLPFGDERFWVTLTLDTRGPGAGFIELAHNASSVSEEPRPMHYRVELTTSRPHFGGCRYWFVCPSASRRVAKLYLPLGGDRFLSRAAYR